ncbi:MAG: hypothetical protein GY898_07390 [Proteobacteria bacterium]|nr:hypothetical protein [Pseudomonadota bacterium]
MLVLDFDGTLTDAELEGKPFRAGYLGDLAALTGAPRDEIEQLADGFEQTILEAGGRYGWDFGGRIVAPASVDPYLRIMPVARMVFDHYGAFPSAEDRSRLLDGILYKYNYPKSGVNFRPGAFELLSSLEGSPSWIVTNSATLPVQAKVRTLAEQSDKPGSLDWLVERVHGFGKKYVIDDAWNGAPEAMYLDGLDRPVLLRRSKYFDVLDELRASVDAAWSDLTVVGDIFELDLALPLHLGARVGLVTSRFTPPWEREFLADHPRGELLSDLTAAAAFIA